MANPASVGKAVPDQEQRRGRARPVEPEGKGKEEADRAGKKPRLEARRTPHDMLSEGAECHAKSTEDSAGHILLIN